MKKAIVFIVLSLLSLLARAAVQVQVDPPQISFGEAFRLIITQTDPQTGGLPDLTVLQNEFEIIGTERHLNYSVINGQAQTASQWIVTLKPLKSGIVTIPPIKLGTEQSTPLAINVDANPQAQALKHDANQQQDVMLITTADEKKPLVNQQVIYKVKVLHRKRLLDADYQGPKLDNALLIPLGDSNRYQAAYNNINYVVEEQSYAIFPQKSGDLKVTSPSFTALVYDLNPQRIKAEDKALNLTVQPTPKNYQGKNWLPAKQVKLSEHYENTNQNLNQGSTLIRTVTLEGVAIPAQLLPSLHFTESEQYSIYPEKGKEQTRVQDGGLIGSVEFKVTYLFKKPGKISIPELKLAWFNTTTAKEEVTTLPPRSLEITPSAVTANPASVQTNEPVSNTIAAAVNNNTANNRWAWVVAIGFAVAWIVTVLLWIGQRKAKNSRSGKYKKALVELNKACTECNPTKARDALLHWAALHWPDAPLLNLTDLTKLVRDAHLKKQLNLLSQVLYKTEERTLWRGDELLRSVLAIKRIKTGTKQKTKTLPPINPL